MKQSITFCINLFGEGAAAETYKTCTISTLSLSMEATEIFALQMLIRSCGPPLKKGLALLLMSLYVSNGALIDG